MIEPGRCYKYRSILCAEDVIVLCVKMFDPDHRRALCYVISGDEPYYPVGKFINPLMRLLTPM